jgi:hypothetical protein
MRELPRFKFNFPDEFPNPPVIADDLQTLVGNVLTTRDEITHYQALAVAATNRNHTHVQNLSDAIQPRGQTLEFRVIASNKAGDSAVSNSVAVLI